jgi:serine/threonine protein kinase/Flp pilus assembly protein TadD
MAIQAPQSKSVGAELEALASWTVGGSQSLDPSGSLATCQVDEMVAAWRRGERPVAEDFLARHPELGPDAAIRLIYEEACLRREVGLEVDYEAIVRRFPQWRAELGLLLKCQQLMETPPGTMTAFPQEGDTLAGFRLVHELGRGTVGRVFLAIQPSLADRPVVVKVTVRGRREHLSLARLQHMNIVPLYSEHVLQARNLQILCMPFLGGATLAQVLERLKDQTASDRSGRALLEALDEIQRRLPVALETKGPLRQFIARASYVEAICLIGACLADGLQYAHDRELLHMDVKPSNVLLASDGQPMLLDFHLAQGPISPGAALPSWAGGTPGYMSPEHWAVLNAVRERRPVPRAVDRRADIYSLGALMYEALGGPVPRSPDVLLPPVCQLNPRVTVGLSDIIQKSLRPSPGGRYRDASALANDLRRHLTNLPLQGVPNRSVGERWRKWRQRRPAALSRAAILLALAGFALLAAGSFGRAYRQRSRDIDHALAQGHTLLERRQFADAAETFRRGLGLAEEHPGGARRRAELASQLARAARGAKREELHQLTDLIRFRYGLALPPREEAASLIHLGHAIWAGRRNLIGPVADYDTTEVDDSTRTDLLDLMVLWASLRVHLAPPQETNQARKEALTTLMEVKAVIGTSPSLERDCRTYAPAQPAGRALRDPAIGARSAWEHFDLGKSYLRSGDLELARFEFRLGLELRPQDFWLNFYDGLCAYRLRRFEEAASAFRVAIALAPASAECRYNRGLAYQALGHLEEAMADYGRASELDQGVTDAALNRGMLLYQLGRYGDARTVLNQALVSASGRQARGMIYYNLALVDWADGRRESCAANAQAALDLGINRALELHERLNR